MNRGKITTIHDMLLNSQNKYSNRVAFKRFNGEIIDEISYDRFVSDVMSVSSYFDDFKNQRFGIYAYMSYEWIVLFYAILYSGNTAVLFNRDYNVHELDEALEIVELEGMFSDLEDAYINRTVSVDEIVEEYKQKTASSVEKKINKNDIAIIIFTSGTTSAFYEYRHDTSTPDCTDASLTVPIGTALQSIFFAHRTASPFCTVLPYNGQS